MWVVKEINGYDALGYLPKIIRGDDPRPVKEQVAERYAHGGGWSPFPTGKWTMDQTTGAITYPPEEPGDEPEVYEPIALTTINHEKVFVYPHALVAVLQNDGTFDVVRMD